MLRGLAAAMVVCVHSGERVAAIAHHPFPLPAAFGAGFAGVDLFFVLSGFIIFYAHSSDLGMGRIRPYAVKRFIRIYPIYWVVMAATLAWSAIDPTVTGGTFPAAAHFIKSFFLVPQQRTPVIFVSWTLVHELRFYFAFGLAMTFKRRTALYAALVTLALSSVVFVIESFTPPHHNALWSIVLFVFHPSNLEFALGIVAAIIVLSGKTTTRTSVVTLITGCIFTWASLQFHEALAPGIRHFQIALFAPPSFFLVLGAVLVEQRWALRGWKLLTLLGDASYSIYLIHVPLLNALMPRAYALFGRNWNDTIFTIFVIAACNFAGVVVYVGCEKPLIRSLRERFSPAPSAKTAFDNPHPLGHQTSP